MRRLAILVPLLALGCRAEEPAADPGPIGVGGLDLQFASDTSIAGEAAAYTATLFLEDGSRIPEVTVTLVSNLEPDVMYDQGVTWPTVAGTHTFTAVVEYSDAQWSDEAYLRVDPGPAAMVDLQLSAAQTPAGQPLTYAVVAADAFQNPIDASRVMVTADSADVLIVDPNVVSKIPGIYTATAAVDEVSDTEQFRVVAGAAATLDLSLSSTDLEVYETAIATAVIRDAYGNEVDADWDLSVETEGDARISGRQITFWSEGWFNVYGRYEGLEDMVGPILVDSTGPTIIIDDPDRGGWSTDETGTVSGTIDDDWSSIEEATLNGEEIPVADDGTFSTTVDYEFGLNILETSATDSDGNSATDTRSVLQGEFLAYGSPANDGLIARINQSGFDTIESLGEGMINGLDLAAMIPNPVYSAESESCIDLWFDEICITWYSIALYIDNPSIDATDLEIDPNAAGYLDTTFTVYNPSLEWLADGTVLGIGLSANGEIYADSITINMQLTPYVSAGTLGITVGAADVSSSGFTFDWDSWIYDVMSFFGLDLSALIEAYMESAVESLIVDDLPDMLADTLASLELATSFEMSGIVFDFVAEPSSVSVDDLGMTLGLATYMTTRTWTHFESGLGSLAGYYSEPAYTSDPPSMAVSLSLDFFNQVFYAAWGAGLLDQSLTADALGISMESFGTFLGMTDLSITTSALLPPVVIPGTDDALMELQVGDLELTLYDGPVDPANVTLQVYVSLLAGFDVTVTDSLLSPSLGDVTVYFDVTVPAANTSYAADTEDLLDALIPLLLPAITGTLGEIPLPALDGFSLTLSDLRGDGAENGYLTLDGVLAIE